MKIGFIGCGNMGKAMIRGILDSGKCTPQEIMISTASAASLEKKSAELGVQAARDNCEVAVFSDILVLAVKPQYYPVVIREVKDRVTAEQLIVTLAPGKTLAWLEEEFGHPRKIIRTMPNTPAMVKEGMTALCANTNVLQADLDAVRDLFSGFSRTEVISEKMMDAVTAVSGSSPAYVFLFIEAMADAAVAEGLPRSQAYTFAAQAVLGSARMVLETGLHPGELKDMVCSPAGTTIEAVRVLEEKGFRGVVMDAVKACAEKSRGM